MERIVIIGFGNILMGDDGAGIHLVRQLGQQVLPAGVELLDGGVNSFAALSGMGPAQRGILVDAMAAGGNPGDIYRLSAAELSGMTRPAAWSLHDVSLADSLRLLNRLKILPPLIVYGIEPWRTELSMELSPPVAAAVSRVAARIAAELETILQEEVGLE